jgi:hypothetical protein
MMSFSVLQPSQIRRRDERSNVVEVFLIHPAPPAFRFLKEGDCEMMGFPQPVQNRASARLIGVLQWTQLPVPDPLDVSSTTQSQFTSPQEKHHSDTLLVRELLLVF